ncbi:nickel-dependent lactate racemase [Anaerotruncus rubiinfantis]|uniref:nickel-dependent lactate racemase n=1 Tax=Anaerotruncus rubiinfantis TaxID=1720200 RepID=UPI001897DCA5|nr:nickel-dependent lactate racemase [Anaerotruncus rubiinfantis]
MDYSSEPVKQNIEIGYGMKPQMVAVEEHRLLGILKPNAVAVERTGRAAVDSALQCPVGSPRLRELVKPGMRIVIITSDITRPLPSGQLIPAVLEELYAAGVDAADITIVFALGSHRRQTEAEMRRLVGDEVYQTVRCMDSDTTDFVRLGSTRLGTPVDITRVVAEADFRIGLGNIEFHYFAGYSGGAKAIMPGVSTRAAIQANHSRMVLPEAAAGRLEDNPVRMDIEDAVRLCPLHFIVNVVLDEHKQILHAVAGDFILAHREGCRFLDRLYKIAIPSRADIVIASQGGAPKDLNLYQTQKALDNAKHAVKPGGIIILVGSCQEGLGEKTFEEWMTGSASPRAMIERIQTDFQLGGHKAAAIALVLENADIYLVSEMEADFVRKIHLQPYRSVQQALDDALGKLGPDASVLVMPYAGSTLPCLAE